jgi:DNA modification methylase
MKRKTNAQQLLDFDQSKDGQPLPSPKRTRNDAILDGEMPWGLAYAAFSRSFASAAIRELTAGKQFTVVDPFVGSGTSVEASLENGCSCIGIDLNPFSALTSRVRGVEKTTLKDVNTVFSRLNKHIKSIPKSRQHQSNEPSPIGTLLNLLARDLNTNPNQVIEDLCSKKSFEFDNELIALCSITYASRKLANVSRGSNPTWLYAIGEATTIETEQLLEKARDISAQMLDNLSRRARPARTYTQIFNTDFAASSIKDSSINRFLTSPPYLNRLDYVRSNLPEIQRLTHEEGGQIENLRSKMMGTTKIRKLSESETQAPFTSLSVYSMLDDIAAHSSKASSTYYSKFFRQYFLDLERFFLWLAKKTAPNAVGMIVLQDSYYKDIPVPLADIYQEVGEAYGFNTKVTASWSKSNHIGQMSPMQRQHAPGKILTESVIFLEKRAS